MKQLFVKTLTGAAAEAKARAYVEHSTANTTVAAYYRSGQQALGFERDPGCQVVRINADGRWASATKTVRQALGL